MNSKASLILLEILWILFIVVIFVAPVVVGYIFEFNIQIVGLFIGVYGFFNLSHYILQIIFATLNNTKMNEVSRLERKSTKVGLQMVGYKENKDYYRKCLVSIKNASDISKIVVVIDGNDKNIQYMVDIIKEIFPEGVHIKLNKVLSDMNTDEIGCFMNEALRNSVISISQPHKGKREAMYTASMILLEEKMDYILMMDSDTIVDSSAPTLLAKVLDNRDDSVAVTGDVRIFNIHTGLAYITNFKYWAAFNLERAAQSYFGVVSCVSGPLGLYRCSVLKTVIDKWLYQTVCCIKCNFGDDRHMTNLFLNHGKVYYNHNSFCHTETPNYLSRFVAQQTRWGKSFLREYFVGIPAYYKRSLWLGYDMTFLLTYNYFLLFFTVILLESNSIVSMVYLFVAIIIFSSIRGIYGCIQRKSFHYMLFSLYGILYFVVLLPLKLWSFLTFMWNGWGTGNRNTKRYFHVDVIPVLCWIGYIGYRMYRKLEYNLEEIENSVVYIPLVISIFYTIVLFCYLPFSRRKSLEEINRILQI